MAGIPSPSDVVYSLGFRPAYREKRLKASTGSVLVY